MSKAVKDSLVSVVSVMAFLLALVFTGYYFWQNQNLTADLKVREQARAQVLQQLEDFKSQKQIYPKIRAYNLLQQAESTRIKWSKLLQDILQYQNFNLRFDSFSSDPKKQITIRGWSRTMEGVSGFLEALKKDPQITEPFIKSIGKTTQGDSFGYSFDLSFFYNEIEL
ncbi:MAG TPA: PilN domain-containing protein [Candidatus Gracilibacteria bacterium]